MDSEPEYRRYNSHSDRRRWAASYARHKYQTNTEYRAKSQLRYWRRKYEGNADFKRIMDQHDTPEARLKAVKQYSKDQAQNRRISIQTGPPAICSVRVSRPESA